MACTALGDTGGGPLAHVLRQQPLDKRLIEHPARDLPDLVPPEAAFAVVDPPQIVDHPLRYAAVRCWLVALRVGPEKHGTYKSQPVHNWASHGSDALQTGACGFVPDYIPPPNDRYYRKPRPQSA
jgi:hypothetical protein